MANPFDDPTMQALLLQAFGNDAAPNDFVRGGAFVGLPDGVFPRSVPPSPIDPTPLEQRPNPAGVALRLAGDTGNLLVSPLTNAARAAGSVDPIDTFFRQYDPALTYDTLLGENGQNPVGRVVGTTMDMLAPGPAELAAFGKALGLVGLTPGLLRAISRGSKIVDEAGDPMRLLHGTTRVFDEFSVDAPVATDRWFGDGIYMTERRLPGFNHPRTQRMQKLQADLIEEAGRQSGEVEKGIRYAEALRNARGPEDLPPDLREFLMSSERHPPLGTWTGAPRPSPWPNDPFLDSLWQLEESAFRDNNDFYGFIRSDFGREGTAANYATRFGEIDSPVPDANPQTRFAFADVSQPIYMKSRIQDRPEDIPRMFSFMDSLKNRIQEVPIFNPARLPGEMDNSYQFRMGRAQNVLDRIDDASRTLKRVTDPSYTAPVALREILQNPDALSHQGRLLRDVMWDFGLGRYARGMPMEELERVAKSALEGGLTPATEFNGTLVDGINLEEAALELSDAFERLGIQDVRPNTLARMTRKLFGVSGVLPRRTDLTRSRYYAGDDILFQDFLTSVKEAIGRTAYIEGDARERIITRALEDAGFDSSLISNNVDPLTGRPSIDELAVFDTGRIISGPQSAIKFAHRALQEGRIDPADFNEIANFLDKLGDDAGARFLEAAMQQGTTLEDLAAGINKAADDLVTRAMSDGKLDATEMQNIMDAVGIPNPGE